MSTLMVLLLKHLPLINLIDVKLRKQGRLLREGVDYDIDFNDLVVRFHTGKDYQFYTYSMYISINIEYLNDLIKNLFELK